MSQFPTSYLRTNGATVTRNHDALAWGNVMGRIEALSLYIRFIELGTVLEQVQNTVLVQVCDDSQTSPRLLITNGSGTNRYTAAYRRVTAGSSNSAAAVAQPSIGNTVELNVTLSAGAVITLQQSINGTDAAIVTGSVNQILDQAWSAPKLRVNGGSASALVGTMGLRDLLLVRGVQSLATMRRIAGTASR